MDKPFIGQMNRKIALVEKQITQTTTGSEKTTEVTICEPWAAMQDNSGNEDIEGKVIHLINRSYVIRVNTEVKQKGTKLIVVDADRRFEIYHIKEIGKTHLEILCRNHE
jgi:head-tail adaptor